MTTYKTSIGTIIINRREHDYIAMIADRKSQWGKGRSQYEAVGDLLLTHFLEGA